VFGPVCVFLQTGDCSAFVHAWVIVGAVVAVLVVVVYVHRSC
jgi:hypothetical protein